MKVLQGTLETDVSVQLDTCDGSAIGKLATIVNQIDLNQIPFTRSLANLDYDAISGHLNFSANISEVHFMVVITNDTLMEMDEYFSVHLTLISRDAMGVAIDPNETVVTIMDDDGKIPSLGLCPLGDNFADLCMVVW